MGEFMLYLAKAAICLVVFSLFFRLLLVKETFFRFTRITLLAGLIVCSFLPLVKLEISHPSLFQKPVTQLERIFVPSAIPGEGGAFVRWGEIEEPQNEAALAATPGETTRLLSPEVPVSPDASVAMWVPGEKPTVGGKKKISLVVILFSLYLIGVLGMCVRLAISFWRLWHLFRNNRILFQDGNQLVICRELVTPFSFFNYIVLSETDYRSNAKEIILHEHMHIKYRHYLDILFSELFLMLHWFNPAVWSLYNDLREVHEYEADNAVIDHGINARDYQLLLVKKAVGEKRFTSVVNSFNQSKIKNRITMMLRKESKGWVRLKLLFAVPLTTVLLLAFAQPENNEGMHGKEQPQGESADFYLSMTKSLKKDYLVYIFLNEKGELSLINGDAGIASTKTFNLNEETEIAETLTGLIDNAMRKSVSTDLDFILGAQADTKMEKVTSVKYILREAYIKSCAGAATKKKMTTEGVKSKFPLTITYTTFQSSKPVNSVQQVQDNPFFYWDEVRQYCKGKGIQPADLKIESETNRNRRVIMLINSWNQILYRNHVSEEVIKNPDEGNSLVSVQALHKIITEAMDTKAPGPLYYFFQYETSASTRFLFNFLYSTLPSAYDAALEEVSVRDRIDVERLRKEKPLLLLLAIPKNLKINSIQAGSQEQLENKAPIVRTSVMRNGEEEDMIFTIASYNGQDDLRTVSIRSEVISNQSGNDSIRQEAVTSLSALGQADIALVSMGPGVTATEIDDIQTVLDKKMKVKESIFMMNIR